MRPREQGFRHIYPRMKVADRFRWRNAPGFSVFGPALALAGILAFSTVADAQRQTAPSSPVNDPEDGRDAPPASPALEPEQAEEPAAPEAEEILLEPTDDESDAYEALALFTHVIQLVRQDYIEAEPLTYRHLVHQAIRGMLQSLDPHSNFVSAELSATLPPAMQDRTGNATVGLVISRRDGMVKVVAAYDDSPAARAGIVSGDEILEVNGKSADALSVDEIDAMLEGEPGETVEVTVRRVETNELISFELIMEVVRVVSVKNAKILPQMIAGPARIGYVLVQGFYEDTAEYLHEELNKLELKGMEALILDLRNNPGGRLDAARDICGLFVGGQPIIVYTEGRRPAQQEIERAPRPPKERDYPMVILINSGSASASEIVAGALRDLGRAILVGETTFGKGSVQNLFELGKIEPGWGNVALIMTVAKYYTPSRQEIHGVGISPHITVTTTAEEEIALAMLRNQENYSAEELESVLGVEDRQLRRAVDLLRGLLTFEKEFASEEDDVEGP